MASTARAAFARYLRTGRWTREPAFPPATTEFKSNPNHDPENGQFTSGPSGMGVGRRPDASAGADKAESARPGEALLHAAEIAERRALGRHSTGDCYKYVKNALLKAGAVSDYLPGVPAKDAGAALTKRGFINLLGLEGDHIRSPYDAPVGAVLVYDPTPDAKKALFGHIEIRTKTGFASDYVSANARTGPRANGKVGRQRILTGVWIKR